jgi:hypothetical protein
VVGWILVRGSGNSSPEVPDPGTKARPNPKDQLPEKVRDPRAVLRFDHDSYLTLKPGEVKLAPLEADRDLVAVFDVTPTDGPIQATTFVAMNVLELSPQDQANLDRSFRDIRQQTTSIIHCEAKPGDVVACIVRSASNKEVTARIRTRWWSLAEPPPPGPPYPNDDVTKTHLVPPGQCVQQIMRASKSTKWIVEVTPKDGEVYAAMMKIDDTAALGDDPGALSDTDKSRLRESVRMVQAPRTEPLSADLRFGESGYFILLNRSEKFVTVELRTRVGTAAR